MRKSALLSDDGKYRYDLWRVWDEDLPVLTWVMLNPSTADADVDDHTIRKCIAFSRNNGYGGILILNLYAYRSTDPRVLFKMEDDPVGPKNDEVISEVFWLKRGQPVVMAWGRYAKYDRANEVVKKALAWGMKPCHLGITSHGMPKHPLMIPYSQPLIGWASHLLTNPFTVIPPRTRALRRAASQREAAYRAKLR